MPVSRRVRARRRAVTLTVAGMLTIVILAETKWSSASSDKLSGSSPSHSTSSTPGAGAEPGKMTAPSTNAPSSKAPSTKAGASTTPASTAPSVTAAQQRAAAVAKVAALTKGLAAGSYSIAAVNLSTGANYAAGSTSGMWTASDYKLLILEALLHKHGGPLSGTEASEAIPMIENSDNTAGYEEFENLGGRDGLQDGLDAIGLTKTTAGHADPAFTATSAMQMIIALKNLVGAGPLTASSRAYALNLMENVESDQRWGVGVDADAGTDFANKNGWLSIDNSNGPGENDNGLWAVNSVGVIRVNGQQVLMAVMTRHRPDFDSGVALVEALAKAIKPLVST